MNACGNSWHRGSVDMGKPTGKNKYPGATQEAIRDWWERNPMTYDWRRNVRQDVGTREWYEEVDRRLFDRKLMFFAHDDGERPFARLIPYSRLENKDVLEVGCGVGAHARLMAECGARVTAIDLTTTAVELTRQRFQLEKADVCVRQMDAEHMEFADESFDFVWSWGVIHHSADTGQVVREIARVMRPGGEVRAMVYHRRSLNVAWALARGLLSGRLISKGMAETLNAYSDGLMARYFTSSELSSMFRQYFRRVQVNIMGQKTDLLPLPAGLGLTRLKARMLDRIPERAAGWVLRRWGGFLFVVAEK